MARSQGTATTELTLNTAGSNTFESGRLSLRRNFSWTLAGNVVYSASQWAMLVVLARLGSPEIVGRFTLALAITAPVLMFTNLQFRGVQATDAREEYAFGDYLTTRLVMTGIAIAAIAGIAVASGYGGETLIVILVLGLAKACESISDVYYGLLQQHERMDRIALSMFLKGPSSLIVLAAAMLMTHRLTVAVAGLAIIWALLLVLYDMRSGRLILAAARGATGIAQLRPRWKPEVMVRLVRLCLPLGIVMLLISLNTNIPRYFLERSAGARELGFYAAMVYLMLAGTTVVSALGQSASPRLARFYAEGDARQFRSLLLKLLAIGVTLGGSGVAAALIGGHSILQLVYGSEYAEHADVFTWVAVAAAIAYVASFLGYGMTAARCFAAQAPLFLVVTVSTVITCALLIPQHGMQGAVLAAIIAGLVQLGGSSFVVWRATRKLSEARQA